MPFSGTAMAEGKTSANQMTGKTHTAQTTAVEDAESPKTTFPVHVIHKTGNDKENFVIVIMGDGYTAQQQDQFVKDATQKAQGMLTWSPYKEYSDRINIYAIQTISNETGDKRIWRKECRYIFSPSAIWKSDWIFQWW